MQIIIMLCMQCLEEMIDVKSQIDGKKDAVIKMNAGKEHSAPEKKKEAVI